MSIIKDIASDNSTATIKYILDGSAHNNKFTNNRNIRIGSRNVLDLNSNKGFNSGYAAAQFYAVRQFAKNPNKKTQAHHTIISFSKQDFPEVMDPRDLSKQAKQALTLVGNFMCERLPKEAQFIVGIQRDGEGGMLHAHVAINSVLLNGRVLNTNLLSATDKGDSKGLQSALDDYLLKHFKDVTGRNFSPVVRRTDEVVNSSAEQIQHRGGLVWKDELKSNIDWAVKDPAVTDLNSLEQVLNNKYGIDVKKRRASIGKNKAGKKEYRSAYTFSFKDSKGKSHKVRDFSITKNGGRRGLGEIYTPDNLNKIIIQQVQVAQQQARLANNLVKKVPKKRLAKSKINKRVIMPAPEKTLKSAENGSEGYIQIKKNIKSVEPVKQPVAKPKARKHMSVLNLMHEKDSKKSMVEQIMEDQHLTSDSSYRRSKNRDRELE